MPRPMISRAPISTSTLGEAAARIAPTTKTTAASTTTARRERRWVSQPEPIAPSSAPRVTAETTSPMPLEETSKSSSMKTWAPEIIPVS